MVAERDLRSTFIHCGTTGIDWISIHAYFPYAGVSTRHLVVWRLRSLGLFSYPKFEQTMCGPTHKRGYRTHWRVWRRVFHRSRMCSGLVLRPCYFRILGGVASPTRTLSCSVGSIITIIMMASSHARDAPRRSRRWKLHCCFRASTKNSADRKRNTMTIEGKSWPR